MTALDDRPVVATLPLNHPDSAGRVACTRRYGPCIPNWQGESVTPGPLVTCEGAHCERHSEGAVWVHTAECDRRNRDGEFAEWAEMDERARANARGRGRRDTAADRMAIEAEQWRLSSPPELHDGAFDPELDYRKRMAERGVL